MKSPRHAVAWRCACALLLLLVAGCAGPRVGPPGAQGPSPPREAMRLNAAVTALTEALLARARLPPAPAGQPRAVVIDPLIDRATGTETRTTRAMGRRMAAMLARQPGYKLLPFTA